MLVKQELINRIKDYFDLNLYETKVWLALLAKGVASAGEIANLSRVPRSRTYDVLESLEKKGFALVKLGKPVKYIGVKPKMILEKLKNNVRKGAQERMEALSKINLTEEYSQLETLYKSGIGLVKREDISASLKGKSNISNYLSDLIKDAKEEVIICTSADEFLAKIKLFEQTFSILSKAGIKIKLGLSGNEDLIKKIEIKLKMKIKIVNIDAKFFIIDRAEILFYLSKSSDKEDVAIWLNSPFFVEAFSSLFEKAMNEK